MFRRAAENPRSLRYVRMKAAQRLIDYTTRNYSDSTRTTCALQVYSDDMRHKWLARAEEKAYSVPAKLSVPLILCVFPVVLIVIMLPAYVRVKTGF